MASGADNDPDDPNDPNRDVPWRTRPALVLPEAVTSDHRSAWDEDDEVAEPPPPPSPSPSAAPRPSSFAGSPYEVVATPTPPSLPGDAADTVEARDGEDHESETATGEPLRGWWAQDATEVKKTLTDKRLDLDGALRLGILGGKQTGKSYLFQSLVFRTFAPSTSGAMTQFLKGGRVDLLQTNVNGEEVYELDLEEFADEYAGWYPLKQTDIDDQQWYKLRLNYRCGFLRRSWRTIDVEFLDASGEALANLSLDDQTMGPLWTRAYQDATVVVFCLPMWAVFHQPLSENDRNQRDMYRRDYAHVAKKFNTLRRKAGVKHPVRTILALTMADDPLVSLEGLTDRWISSMLDQDTVDRKGRTAMDRHLELVRTARGLNRYLVSARQISDVMNEAFLNHPDTRMRGIPDKLNFGAGRPWIIPLSAIHGETLAKVEKTNIHPDLPPAPVHVELPLLIAICETYNALM